MRLGFVTRDQLHRSQARNMHSVMFGWIVLNSSGYIGSCCSECYIVCYVSCNISLITSQKNIAFICQLCLNLLNRIEKILLLDTQQ